MLSLEQFTTIAEALEASGYAVEAYNPEYSDIMDIWSADESKGFVEITVGVADGEYVVFCPVDYDGDEDSAECFGSDCRQLINQLDRFFARIPSKKKKKG